MSSLKRLNTGIVPKGSKASEQEKWASLAELEAADRRFEASIADHETHREGHRIIVVGKTFWDNTPCERAVCSCGWKGEWRRKPR